MNTHDKVVRWLTEHFTEAVCRALNILLHKDDPAKLVEALWDYDGFLEIYDLDLMQEPHDLQWWSNEYPRDTVVRALEETVWLQAAIKLPNDAIRGQFVMAMVRRFAEQDEFGKW